MNLKLERDGVSIHQADIHPVAAFPHAFQWAARQARNAKGGLKLGVDGRRAAIRSANLLRSAAVTNHAPVSVSIAAELRPVASAGLAVWGREVVAPSWRDLDVLGIWSGCSTGHVADPYILLVAAVMHDQAVVRHQRQRWGFRQRRQLRQWRHVPQITLQKLSAVARPCPQKPSAPHD